MCPNITLRKIDDDNFFACVELKHADERFVASAVFTLADAYASRHYMTTYAIYHLEEVVGLVMVRKKPAYHNRNYSLTEIFIADNHLRKGYGRQAMAAILHKLKYDNGFTEAKVCCDNENTVAQAFFQQCGFTIIGPSPWNPEDYTDMSISLDNI